VANHSGHTKRLLLVLAVLLGVTSCSGANIPLAKATTGRDPTLAEVPDEDETVRANDPPIVTLDLNSALHEHRLTGADELPGNILIPTTNLNAVPVTAALQAVLSGTDVSLSWNTGTLGTRLVTVMNLSGPLPKVVEKICAAAKVFCDYRHGSLELVEKETFVVSLPPVVRSISTSGGTATSGGTNSMVEAIDNLVGSDKAQVDDQGGNIIYTTTVDGEDRVSDYLAQLRTGRPLVVLQMYIWEVTLTRENAQGINWSQLNISSIGKSITPNVTSDLNSAAATAGSVSLGAVTTGIISASAVASFLATKGRVQTISNPQITFVSGTSAELKVGGTTRYISQVGTLTNTTNVAGTGTSANANTNASTNTVSTDSIDTGLTIDVAGSYEEGVVFANLNLALKNLVSLNPTSSGGGTIDLPQTTDEKMNSVLRVRPGDSLVLAGLVTAADTQSSQGLPTGSDSSIPLYGDDQRNNHELVMIVKPSVVLFSDKARTVEAKRKEDSRPLPDALVIDKDGTRTLKIPQAKLAAAVAAADNATQPPGAASVPGLQSPPVGLRPELMENDPQAASMQNISVAPSADGAPVDKLLMQRGFSHAFDQLLAPAGNVASGGASFGGGSP
jgi:MSHA biogenesis protein MshL